MALRPADLAAIVLVGGRGTRLLPVTATLPKPMLPVVGRPIIARVLEWLAANGVRRAVFSLGYQPDAFTRAFPERAWAGVEFSYAVEDHPLDTGGAVRFAAEQGGVIDEPVLVVNGDVLTDLDLGALVSFHSERGAEATIALTPVEDPSAYGVVVTDDAGLVLAFVEKPPREESPGNDVNAGTYVLEPAALRRVPPGRPVSIERETFPALVADGVLYACSFGAYWIDTGTPERFLDAQLDVLTGRHAAVELDATQVAGGSTYLAEGAQLSGRAKGAVFLGAGARAEEGSLLWDSIVDARASVGAGARLERSVVLEGAVVGAGCVVTHSLLGPRCAIGEGAVVTSSILGADERLEDGARLDSARRPV